MLRETNLYQEHGFLLPVGLLMLGSAQDLPCAVSHGAGGTGYSVPAFNASSCHYWWANGTVSYTTWKLHL